MSSAGAQQPRDAQSSGAVAQGIAIQLKGVRKHYRGARALGPLDLEIHAGDLFCIQGANGSGKSTLLSLLATAQHPTLGTVEHALVTHDHAVSLSREQLRCGAAYLGHELGMYLHLSGRENTKLLASLIPECSIRSAELTFVETAERLGASAWLDRPVQTLSRGQKQRIALAASLARRPALLLWDEPTTGLDASSIAQLGSLLGEVALGGMTRVLVTHDETFLQALAPYRPRHLMLNQGRVAEVP